MSNLVSSWSKNVQAVPASYVLPEERRPGDIQVPLCKDIPVVDLARVEGLGRYEVVQTMMKASQDFGNFQIVSNGKLKSALHRAVTNTSTARTSLVNFIGPSLQSIIEPAEALVSESNPKLFKPISSKDYFELYMVAARGPKGSALDLLKL